jgi:hypothetical protein
MAVLLMPGTGEDIEQVGVTTGSAAVLRRAAPSAIHYAGIFLGGIAGDDVLERDHILPKS